MASTSTTRVFAILASAAGTVSLMQSLITPVLPTIQRDLHTDAGTATWVFTSWLLAAAVATPLLGRVGDMIGKRRVLVAALVALAAGCLVAALAPTIAVLIAGRVLQGLGGAVFPLAFGIIRDEFPPARVASAVGGMSAVIAAGGGVGIVLAGPVVGALDWRWLFWLPLAAALTVAAFALRVVPESPLRTPGRINWLAAALMSSWLVALLLPLTKASAWGWTSAPVIGLLAAAAVLLATWIVVEFRSSNPLIDMRMMRRPAVWTTNLVALLFGAGMFGAYAFLPQLIQTPVAAGYGFGASLTTTGLLMLPMLIAMAASGSLSGPLNTRLSGKAQLVIGASLVALACASIAAFHHAPWQVATAGAVFGLGLGVSFAAMINLIVHAVPPSQTGVASGMNTNIRTIGASIGTAVVASIVTGHMQPNGLPYESGYTTAFWVMTGLAATAVALSLLVPVVRPQHTEDVATGTPEPALADA
ncbi:MFS transporter [Catenuloplanes indicus]|uniref:EmrB/QacA subfamily drug resistance transporter n=1 Tax=Catenuloplanes indicus TaxID=137267 RepID=A0AAE4B1C6_9ACTN|nr:MFS transporter [Catenuloplanes indicus]MDQ0371280.1 EmrB/QacA subfamily drug resistance transporter [Catenuloplanes indicus]